MTKHAGFGLVFVSLAGWAIVGAMWPAPDIERAGSSPIAAVGTAQAAQNRGGAGFGFSCDVNTKKCTCSGIWEGADCQAMKKNCDLSRPTACTIYPPYECSCTLAKTIRRPNTSVRPTTPPTAVQGKPN
jgi:hypothetical protein